MKIAVDIDDVLLDSFPTIVEFYRNNYDAGFTLDKAYQYEYLGFLGDTREEAEDKIARLNNSEYCTKAKPFKEAQEAISLLAKSNDIFALTSRPAYIKDVTELEIYKYFPEIKKVIFNNDNLDIRGTLTRQISKADICKRDGIHVLIDDLLRFTNNTHKDLKVFLLDKPWNQGETPDNVIRVSSWSEVLENLSIAANL